MGWTPTPATSLRSEQHAQPSGLACVCAQRHCGAQLSAPHGDTEVTQTQHRLPGTSQAGHGPRRTWAGAPHSL